MSFLFLFFTNSLFVGFHKQPDIADGLLHTLYSFCEYPAASKGNSHDISVNKSSGPFEMTDEVSLAFVGVVVSLSGWSL